MLLRFLKNRSGDQTENQEKPVKRKVGASLLSALSGNPNSQDYKHNRIRNMIDNGRFAKNTQAFSILNESPPEGWEPYDTTWVKSSHGAYVLVRTLLPLNFKGDMRAVPGYAVLFSQHPDFLGRVFLRKNSDVRGKPPKEEIEAKLTVVAARYQHDILQTNPKTGDEYIVTAWMKTAIDHHTATFGKLLKRHGSIVKDSPTLLRSGSSIIWLRPTEKDPSQYDVLYYGNPVFGQVSLFMKEDALDSFWSKMFFRSAAVKISTQPMDYDKAYQYAHTEFARIARGIIRMEDPYDIHYHEVGTAGKIGRIVKKGAVRTLQKVSHSVANINLKALFVATGLSGFLMFVLQAPALMFAASAGKSNLLLKGAQTAARAGAKFLSPVSTLAVNSLNDVSALVAAPIKNNLVTDEVRGLIINADYVDHMHAVPCEFMANTYPDIVPYNNEHEREWARAVILDTLGIQPGTIYSEESVEGRSFLRAEQPNGLDVYYDPEELIACAREVRAPFPHTCLEKPIELLLSELKQQGNFIGVRMGKKNVIDQVEFVSLHDLPPALDISGEASLQALRDKGMDINTLTLPETFPLLDILPPGEAKSVKRKSRKALTGYLKKAFREGHILDPDHEEPRTVDINIENYILKRTDEEPLKLARIFMAEDDVARLGAPCKSGQAQMAAVFFHDGTKASFVPKSC